MNLWHAFRVYPKAMAWSIIITMSIVMDGYDASVMGSCRCRRVVWLLFRSSCTVNAYPSFQQHFGIPAADGTKQIPPSWQNGISGANSVGVIFGLQVGFLVSCRTYFDSVVRRFHLRAVRLPMDDHLGIARYHWPDLHSIFLRTVWPCSSSESFSSTWPGESFRQ